MLKLSSRLWPLALIVSLPACQTLEHAPQTGSPAVLDAAPAHADSGASNGGLMTADLARINDAESALPLSPYAPDPDLGVTAVAQREQPRAEKTSAGNAQAEAVGKQVTAAAPDNNPDLWQLTRQHYGLDLSIDNQRIESQLQWFIKHPRYIHRVIERAERYYHYVLHEVIEQGVPAEIALLPIVESAYDPFAYSHGRAAGPWQFIPGTARHFGLKKSWWYDGRRDIQASTEAALTYLKQLNQRFEGDWLLALAGYNAGGGNVSKAIRKNRKRGKPIDFFSLDLPRETRAYVPKLIALAKIFKDPARYGIELKPLPNRPYFQAVDVGSQIDLSQAAELAGISIDELYLLNPGFNQWATDPEGPHQLLVPLERAEPFEQALAALPKEQRVSWMRYRIRRGDSLSTIAKRHNTTTDALRTTNNLRGNLIRAGQVLMIPTASSPAKTYALSDGQRQAKKSQRIALRSGKTKLSYKVRQGDSFWTIARRHGVSVRSLASWNQMAPGDPLRIGRKLTIWQETPVGTVADRGKGPNVIRKIGYRVRQGDSLSRIASRFKVTVKDIQRWNTLDASRYLQPGQQLTLYVDVTRAR